MPATSTTNFPGLLTPTYGGKAMPYTGKQERFIQGIAHGMKPYTKTSLSPEKAKEMLGHEKKKVEARKKGMTRALEKM